MEIELAWKLVDETIFKGTVSRYQIGQKVVPGYHWLGNTE